MGFGIKPKLDYSDYVAAPENGRRYEILSGILHVTPAPSPRHQRISLRVAIALVEYFETRRIGQVYPAPIDLILSDHDVVQPDIAVVSNRDLVTERGIEGPPLLVVEILSPTTRSRDRGVKATRYAEMGVAHYWLIDPDERRVVCFRIDSGAYRVVADAGDGDRLVHPDWTEFVLDLSTLWS